LLAVLAALGDGCSDGLEVIRATGLPSGTLYPLLARFEEQGWCTARWAGPEGQGSAAEVLPAAIREREATC
jgi:DNA-binding PadR family transcriptional regulator